MTSIHKEKLFSKDFFVTYAWLLSGCFIFALGAVLFAEPYGFAPGGTYGLSMVFHNLWGWSTEITALSMDIPLLLLGIYFLGTNFGIKTVVCTLAIPGSMWLIHLGYGYIPLLESADTIAKLKAIQTSIDLSSVAGMETFTKAMRPLLKEQMLSSVFGGVVYGLGIGMIFKSRSTSGGSDIIAMILNKYTHISLGTLVICVDCTITLSTVVAFDDWKLPMYSWIIVFIEGKMIDLIVDGLTVHKTLIIITDEVDEVKGFILKNLNRGATLIPCVGSYKGEKRNMIYTVVTRKQFLLLRKFISQVDPHAFINIIESKETLGSGFKNIEED